MTIDECRDLMTKWFLSDTVELIDSVLNDDPEDPQYSAISTLNRLWTYCRYMELKGDKFACDGISALLDKLGYASKDIDLFREKCISEKNIYRSEILDSRFIDGKRE